MSAHATPEDATTSDRKVLLGGAERRRSPRAPLHWTLYLACSSFRHPVRTTTRDINNDGFYCLVDQPLRPGEQIDCDIVVPANWTQDPDDVLYLRCRAQAVRVEKVGAGTSFGVACRFDDYRVIRGLCRQPQSPEKGTEPSEVRLSSLFANPNRELKIGDTIDESAFCGIHDHVLER